MAEAEESSTFMRGLYWSDAVLAATLGAGVGRFTALAQKGWFVDEQAGLVTGWLLARGGVLYKDVFSHHLPFEFVVAQLVASLFGPSILAARAASATVWSAACVLLHLALRRRGAAAGWIAPLFAALFLCWAPLWRGNLLLVELYWSLALAILVALWDPLDHEKQPLSRVWAAVAGALAVSAGASSLAALVPTGLALTALASAERLRGRRRAFMSGAAAFTFPFLLWSLRHVYWSGFLGEALRFNFDYYSRYNGFPSTASLYGKLISGNLIHWLGGGPLSRSGIEPFCTASGLSVCALIGYRSGLGRGALALLILLFSRFAVEAPGLSGTPLFHASAYYVLCVLAWAAALSWLITLRPAWAGVSAAVLLMATYPAWRDRLHEHDAREKSAVARLVAEVTDPDDKVLALPSYPQFYMDSRRPPGLPYVLYLPWIADSEQARALHYFRSDPPKIVFLESGFVGRWSWPEYGTPLVHEIYGAYVPYLLDSPYGGRILGPADENPSSQGLYVLRSFEPQFIERVREKGLMKDTGAPLAGSL